MRKCLVRLTGLSYKIYFIEEIAKEITINISHAVKILAAVIVGIAIIKTLLSYFSLLQFSKISREEIRMQFLRFVAAVAPRWDGIGKLSAVAVLRAGLNYFLDKELQPINVRSRAFR